MDAPANKRIDAGIKRGPRRPVDRRPKAALTGLFVSKHSPEERSQIVLDAQQSLLAGETTEQIAERLKVPGRTLRYWLLDDPNTEIARRALINGELARTLEEMREAKHSDSPLPLACAREEFRAWSWIAERRESRLYGQKQEVNHTVTVPQAEGLLSDALQLLSLVRDQRQERVIEEEKPIESVEPPKLGDA